MRVAHLDSGSPPAFLPLPPRITRPQYRRAIRAFLTHNDYLLTRRSAPTLKKPMCFLRSVFALDSCSLSFIGVLGSRLSCQTVTPFTLDFQKYVEITMSDLRVRVTANYEQETIQIYLSTFLLRRTRSSMYAPHSFHLIW
jgi:hypothetical protein